MQTLWARVLSGEANSPGSFSKRTVNLLASLDKADAELFSRLCSFCWLMGGELVPLVYSVDDPLLACSGISFAAVKHLDDIGLIRFESLRGFSLNWGGDASVAAYHGRVVLVTLAQPHDGAVKAVPPGQERSMDIGHVLLSKVGRELATICQAPPVRMNSSTKPLPGGRRSIPTSHLRNFPHTPSQETVPPSAATDDLSQGKPD